MTTTEQKTPAADEWWISKNNNIVRIVGVKLNGQVVYEMNGGVHSASSGMWPNWHHEPSCTSFDWKPPAPIDPGEGWEVLVKPCRLEQDDEALLDGKWYKTCYAGTMYIDGDENIYRRMKPTAEQWPKYVVNDDWSLTAYLIRDSETSYTAVQPDGTEEGVKIWDKHCSILIDQGTWRYVTEAEALARVKPAETWPKYYVCDTWCHHAYITRDSDGKLTPYFNDGRRDSHTRDWDEMDDMNVDRGSFREVTEAEALARVKPAETITQSGERTATPLVPAVVESPDDWVEITESHPGHIRRACDEVCNTECEPVWIPVRSSVGMPQSDFSFTRIRCRRRDLPALPAPLPTLIPGVATDRMVDLFLSWRLPSDFQPDGGISFTSRPIHESWPTGTNLFTASQARKMIEHLLSVPEETAPQEPQPKRIPLSLWVHGNVTEVGGWSVFAGRPNFGSYKEIKFDGSGFYVVEGE